MNASDIGRCRPAFGKKVISQLDNAAFGLVFTVPVPPYVSAGDAAIC